MHSRYNKSERNNAEFCWALVGMRRMANPVDPLSRLKELLPSPIRGRLGQWYRDLQLRRALNMIRTHDAYVPLSDETVRQLMYGWGNPWALQEELITELWHHAWLSRAPVLECGSGLSTLLLGIAAEHQKFEVYSLEHDEDWYWRMFRHVQRLGLSHVTLVYAPLVSYGHYDWYAPHPELPAGLGLVLCDGPPASTTGGRYGLIPQIHTLLAPDTVILLDDAARPGEQEVLLRWASEFGLEYTLGGQDKPYAKIDLHAAWARRTADNASVPGSPEAAPPPAPEPSRSV